MTEPGTNYNNSYWTDDGFIDDYLNDSNIYIPQRKHVLQLFQFIFSFYIGNGAQEPSVVDLGCGDGIVSRALLAVNRNLLITLVDGSEKMLESARIKIPEKNIKKIINIPFQALIGSSLIEDGVNCFVSSLAIHHLNTNEKKMLYTYIYSKLNVGGLFINYDPVLSASQELEQLNLSLWKEWIVNYEAKLNPKRSNLLDYIPSQYKNNKDNIPDTIDSQLEMMKQVGFLDVNLYYKHGLFCLFGGRK